MDLFAYMLGKNAGGGGSEQEDGLVTRTLTAYENSTVSSVGDYAFYNFSKLTSINLPNATTIGNNAFCSCSKLTSIDLPNATSIGSSAFYYCSALTSVDLPLVASIGSSTFYYCYNLISINLPNATSIGNGAFSACNSLTSINLPNVTSIGNNAFYGCAKLTLIDSPNVTSIGNSAFVNCNSLTSINLSNVTSIGNSTFYSCRSLSLASLSQTQTIGSNAFTYCYYLLSLYLPYSGICSIAYNAFNSTPIAGYTASTGGVYGSIYVPASLYREYCERQTRFASRFARIESPITITLVGYGLSLSATTYSMTWQDWVINGPEPEDFVVEINGEEVRIFEQYIGQYYWVCKDEDLTIRCTANDMIEETTYYLNLD